MVRDFRLLATGQALSWLGTGFQTVALSVAVITTGGSPGDLGAVQACSVGALLIGTLFGGVWADRLEPRSVLVAADLVRCAAVSAMAVLFAVDGRSVVLLCFLAAVTSAAGSFFNPAMSSLKPLLVDVDERRSANSTLSLLQTGASVVGPAAAGVVVASAGPAAGFSINAASFLVSVATVLALRVRVPDRAPRDSLLHDLGAGWREIDRHDWLRAGILAATVYHVANGVLLVLTQVVIIRQLGGAHSVGLVAAAEGLGGASGAFVALRTRPSRPLRNGWTALLLMPLWATSYVWPGTLIAVVAGGFLGYAGLLYFDVAWETAIQDHVPHGLLARVASWDTLTSFVAMPVGNALAGPLANGLGIRPVLVGCAVVLAGASLAPLASAGTRHLGASAPAALAPAPPETHLS